jgi:hypothetical protein
MNPSLIGELQNAGVMCDLDDTPEAVIAALQARIVHLVTSTPEAFDRATYERLMRTWEDLSASRDGEPS